MGNPSKLTGPQQLKASPIYDREVLLQRFAETIDQVFWFTDANPELVLYVSPAFETIWGRTVEELYDRSRLWIEAIHPDDRQRVSAEFGSWLQGRSAAYEVEYRIVRPDGTIRWILDHGAQIRDEKGTLNYISGVAKDITQEKEAKNALDQALTELTQLKERLELENTYLQEEVKYSHRHGEIVGDSVALRSTLQKIEQVARTDASVLLLGETGTGKSRFAWAIHKASRRKDRPLVKVNCAALPASLIESELFGHRKGAFTGALDDRLGRFQLADGGTIFLDEIGELDLDLQAKLLRILQDGEFEQVGSQETLTVDVRIVAATNRDLHHAMNEGSFRADLYYRLAVFPVEVPPLRMRQDDIPLLVWHFISEKRIGLDKVIDDVPQAVMRQLLDYQWPGNVRELENVIERAMILSPSRTLELDEVFDAPTRVKSIARSSATLEQVDRDHIVDVLEACDWTIKGPGRAADRLGLAPSTLRYRMKKLGIERKPRKPR
jgi:formate hydrogenlyase transcriptional activator